MIGCLRQLLASPGQRLGGGVPSIARLLRAAGYVGRESPQEPQANYAEIFHPAVQRVEAAQAASTSPYLAQTLLRNLVNVPGIAPRSGRVASGLESFLAR